MKPNLRNGRYDWPDRPFKLPAFAFLRLPFHRSQGTWPKQREDTLLDKPPARVEGSKLRVSFINHATLLIQTQGLNILIDPMWSKRASPISWLGPKRIHSPGVRFEDLPPIDVILLSHAHFDHCDLPTLRRLASHDPLVVAGLGMDSVIGGVFPVDRMKLLNWQDSISVGGLKVHFLPSQHWSNRNPFQINRQLWGAFVLECEHGNVYLSGDTGYAEHFVWAKERFGPFRFAALTFGAYEPRSFMKFQHMNPSEAVRAHVDLGSKHTLGLHHGTFRLSHEGFEQAFEELDAARKEQGVSQDAFRTLVPGDFWWIPEQ